MKMSYKIALAASLIVFIIAVVIIARPSDESTTETQSADISQTTTPPSPRTTLKDRPTASAPATKPETNLTSNPPTPRHNNASLVDDVHNRLKAAGNDAPNDTVKTVSTEPVKPDADATPAPGPIPLTRTDAPNTTSTPPTPKPGPAVDAKSLDEILGKPPAHQPNDGRDKQETTTAAVATSSSPPSTAQPDGTYTVQPSDTFSSIAKKHYGDESRWFDIAQANPTVDPMHLRVGQVLKLPAIEKLQTRTEPQAEGPGGVKTYIIRPGDSLSTVANKFYGDPTLWRTIYNFNRDKIGDNPNAIKAGMDLKVPPRVKGAE